jgi:hypothetical protein
MAFVRLACKDIASALTAAMRGSRDGSISLINSCTFTVIDSTHDHLLDAEKVVFPINALPQKS